MNDDFVVLSTDEYRKLMQDREKLQALEGAGVDNWEGYDIAMEDLVGYGNHGDS